jgi:MATE family multidrug resistance protein
MSPSPSRFALLRREMRTTLVLAFPLILGHVSTGLIGFVDAVLAGRHSANTLASVAVGAAIWSVAIMVLIGILLALPPSVSQLDGARRRGEIGPLFRQGVWLALGLSAALFVFLSLAGYAFEPMGIAPEIQDGARDFLHGIRWGVPALALYFCMRYLSEGVHWTLPTMVFGIGGLAVLVPLGYALMFGTHGLPEMGAAGLGYATSIMLWMQAAGFALYLRLSRRFDDLALFSRFDPPDWTVIRNLLKLGLPIGVTIFMEGSLFIATALLIGRMGEVPVAAHQIAINVGSITFMGALGLAEATTVRVGHAIGQQRASAVRYAALAGYLIVLAAQSMNALVILFANEFIASIYTHDAAVIALASTLLLFAAAFQLSDGVQVVSGAALRGLKDTRVPMALAAFSYWGVGMPLGATLGLGLGWGAPGMWVGLVAGLSFAALLLTWRFVRMARRLEFPVASLPAGPVRAG